MRVKELLPLQAFLTWLRKYLPKSVASYGLPGGADPRSRLYAKRYVVKTRRRNLYQALWHYIVHFMVEIREDETDHTEQAEASSEESLELEALKKASQYLQDDMVRLQKSLGQLSKIFDDQATMVDALTENGSRRASKFRGKERKGEWDKKGL